MVGEKKKNGKDIYDIDLYTIVCLLQVGFVLRGLIMS